MKYLLALWIVGVLLTGCRLCPLVATETPAPTPAQTSNAFFNDSDRQGQYVFFVHDTTGTCADFLAGRLAGENQRRLVISINGLAQRRYTYPAEDSSVWCYSVTGPDRDGAISRCAAGALSITSVAQADRVAGEYRFQLEDGRQMEGPLLALYCPFAD